MTDRRLAFFLWIAAFLARYTLYLGTTIYGTDSAQFLLMAQWMKEGRFHEALAVTYHPLYPLLTAALGVFVSDLERAGFWVSIVLGSTAAVPLFFLIRSIFGRPAAVVTALLYAVQPHTVEVQADVMTEGTFAFFFFSAIWLSWRAIEKPSFETSILAGLAASAAYLTRAEGVLAVALAIGWPILLSSRRSGGRWNAVLRSASTALVALLLAFPFLLWVRSEMGTWKLSVKWSVRDAERAVGEGGLREEDPGEKEGKTRWSPRYAKLLQSLGRLTYIVTAPFLLLGLAGLRGQELRGSIFYFSFPLGYLAGILWSLRSVPYMSYRYVLPVMNLLTVLAGLGVVVLAKVVSRRWGQARAEGAALAAVALMVVVMAAPALRPHRIEETEFRAAGAWLVAHQTPQMTYYTATDKFNFAMSGQGMRGFPSELREFQAEVSEKPADYYVFTEKDLNGQLAEHLAWLRKAKKTGEPIVFASDRPGIMTVSVFPAR